MLVLKLCRPLHQRVSALCPDRVLHCTYKFQLWMQSGERMVHLGKELHTRPAPPVCC